MLIKKWGEENNVALQNIEATVLDHNISEKITKSSVLYLLN